MEEWQKDCEVISLFLESNKGRSVIVFSDGSVYKGPVGGSACAAVLYPLSVNESYSTESNTVGHKVTALKCEIEGIALGLEVALQYYLKFRWSFNIAQYLYILCDCSVAIDSIFKSNVHAIGATLYRRITSLCKELCGINVKCLLALGLPDFLQQNTGDFCLSLCLIWESPYVTSMQSNPNPNNTLKRNQRVWMPSSSFLFWGDTHSLGMPALRPASQAGPMRNPREGTSVVLRDLSL